MVKLIHFQGYPPELLPMMVSGVPSIHISLDFIPELLGQPQPDKQVCFLLMTIYGNMCICTHQAITIIILCRS